MWKNLVYFGSVFFVFNLTFCPVDIFPWVPVIKHHMRSCEKMITSWGYTSSLFELKTELFLCETSVPQDEFLTVSLNDLLCAYLRKPEFHTYCILEGIAKGTSKCWTKRLKMCYFFLEFFVFFKMGSANNLNECTLLLSPSLFQVSWLWSLMLFI